MDLAFWQRFSLKDKALLTRQLATMVSSGIPLNQAFALLADQTKKAYPKKVLTDLVSQIEEGHALSVALARHPRAFDQVYVSLVRAGEAAGKLDQVLSDLAQRLEDENDFSGQLKSALAYPIFIILVMIVVSVIMMVRVVPQLESIFREAKVTLPWTTRTLIATAGFFQNAWWLVLLALLVVVLVLRSLLKTEAGQIFLSQVLAKEPLGFGQSIYMVRFSRTLGLLIEAGVPIIEAVGIVAEAMNNKIYKASLKKVADEIERGIPLSVPLSENPYFPTMVSQLVAVGEQTGKVDQALNSLASFYEDDVGRRVKTISSLIEPAIIVLIGLGVAFMVMSILVPIYQITQFQ